MKIAVAIGATRSAETNGQWYWQRPYFVVYKTTDDVHILTYMNTIIENAKQHLRGVDIVSGLAFVSDDRNTITLTVIHGAVPTA